MVVMEVVVAAVVVMVVVIGHKTVANLHCVTLVVEVSSPKAVVQYTQCFLYTMFSVIGLLASM